tara:strand:+ start:3800 stop:4285 length:486 start_codon:yes stop_codon:yes gene_type:complete
MIDPLTLGAAVSTASSCYKAVVSMIQAGKEFEDCSATLGKWMGAVSDINNIHKKSNNPTTIDKLFNGSIEQVAMESFAAKKQIQKQREDLKNWLIGHYGLQAWDDLLKEEGRIRKARQEAIYAKEEQQKMIRDYTIMSIACLIGAGGLGWMIWLISYSVTR